MTATLLMTPADIAADEPGWLERRRAGITASEIAIICGVAPESWGGPYSLYHKKRSGGETEDREEMERGRLMEPIVLSRFEADHPGLVMLPGGLYASAGRPWQMATFDAQAIPADLADRHGITAHNGPSVLDSARITAEVAPVQAKTSLPRIGYGAEDTDTMPAHYKAQLTWEMRVREAPRGFLAVQFLVPWQFRTFVREADEQWAGDIAWMEEQAEEFRWRLEAGKPPPVDHSAVATETLRRLYPGADIERRTARIPLGLARRYRRAGVSLAKAAARRSQAVNEILERAGNADLIVTRDPQRGQARDGHLVRVATRTAGARRGYTVPAKPEGAVVSLNPCGWAKGGTP